MQLLSHGFILAADPVPPVSPRFEELLGNPLFAIGLFFAWIVLRLLVTWLASKAVMRSEMGTFGRAALLLVGHLALGFALGLALGILLPIAAKLQPAWRQITVIGGVIVLGLIGMFKIPMKIYEIGFWRSFGLLFCAGCLEGLVLYTAQLATGLPVLAPGQVALLQKNDPPFAQFLGKMMSLSGKEARDEIDRLLDEAATLTQLREREAAVRHLQKKLVERKLSLPPGDAEAAANFQKQLLCSTGHGTTTPKLAGSSAKIQRNLNTTSAYTGIPTMMR